MVTIEMGADGRRIKPYVTTFSKSELSEKLNKNGFSIDQITVRQLEANHFGPILGCFIPSWLVGRLDHILGWYVAAIARKL